MEEEEGMAMIHSCNTMERYAFTYREHPGLRVFHAEDLLGGEKEYNTVFGIDWTSEEMQEEVLSEITIKFVGKSDSFLVFKIELRMFSYTLFYP